MAIVKDLIVNGAARFIADAYFNTIKAGTWNGNTIDVSYGGTGKTSVTSGYLLVGNGTSAMTERLIVTSLGTSTSATTIPTAGAVYTALSNLTPSGGGSSGKIPFATVDSTSTSTAFTATVPEITALTDGACVLLKNGVVTSAADCTLNINNLGAKPIYYNLNATRQTTLFNANYTFLFVYDSTKVSNGAWVIYGGYDSNTDVTAYQVRHSQVSLPVSDTARYYKIYFTSADGTLWVPASANSTNSATSSKDVNQRPIDPFGKIVYSSKTSSTAQNSSLPADSTWEHGALTLGYSFNRTGAALVLQNPKPVYIKCTPQSDGSAIIDPTTPYTQTLPTTFDGKIYIYLGIAYSATTVEMFEHHPVYYHNGNLITQWTGDLNTPISIINGGSTEILDFFKASSGTNSTKVLALVDLLIFRNSLCGSCVVTYTRFDSLVNDQVYVSKCVYVDPGNCIVIVFNEPNPTRSGGNITTVTDRNLCVNIQLNSNNEKGTITVYRNGTAI